MDLKHTKLTPHHGTLDLRAVREKLRACSGKQWWRSLEELAEDPHFEEFLHQEFPRHASEWSDSVSRRRFLKLMAASLALAGLEGCAGKPKETIVPYARAPEEVVTGKPLYFATAMTLAGSAIGLLVESHEGRPTKIEGNPDHPASLGASDVFSQASLLTLYDPDRSQVITYLGDIRPWAQLLAEIRVLLERQRVRRGAGLRLLTETILSPTLAQQIRSLIGEFPEAKWHQYEPASRDAAREGSRMAFGRYVNTIYQLENADVILALDADFLSSGTGCLRYARQFARRRRPQPATPTMSRLYAVECTPSNTGAMADHRLPLRASEIENFTRRLARVVGGEPGAARGAPYTAWLEGLARDLVRHRGKSLVIPGEQQTGALHAWTQVINSQLGNFGSTVIHTDPVEAEPTNQLASLAELAADIDAGRVEWLVLLGGNPVYNAPADLAFAKRLLKVPLRMHLG
ncbi:MAG TPA: TAT-variant-translocated molybdopterin oxidoreductase, partial [Candidatus Acidoferrales bacterium]|nr:TAT-variant-translocated molybdopterin oxidoreductase [Candidatus Acidoferrales bacterium]